MVVDDRSPEVQLYGIATLFVVKMLQQQRCDNLYFELQACEWSQRLFFSRGDKKLVFEEN